MPSQEDLKRTMRDKTTEELYLLLNVHSQDYKPEALEIAGEELSQRQLDGPTMKRIARMRRIARTAEKGPEEKDARLSQAIDVPSSDPPIQGQIDLCRRMGLEIPAGATKGQVSAMIDARLSLREGTKAKQGDRLCEDESRTCPSQGKFSDRLYESLVDLGHLFLGFLGLFILGFVVFAIRGGYEWLHSSGLVSHEYDTPVWIQGDWMVGEYRDCQMRTKTAPKGGKDLDSLDKLPRLFCGESANGLSEFEREISQPSHEAQTGTEGTIDYIGVTASEYDHDFHIMQVRYWGRIDRQDEWVISWHCLRRSESLECKALD